jgi:flagellar hook assembly protein FlgD
MLHPNAPNPFYPSTVIRYELAVATPVRLRVFDATGRLVRVLVEEGEVAPSGHRVVWDGRDENGRPAASGTYFYRLEAGSTSESRSMILLR